MGKLKASDEIVWFVSLKNFSLIWRRSPLPLKVFLPILGTHGLWAVRVLEHATPTVTRIIHYNGHFRGSMTFAPVAERLAVDLFKILINYSTVLHFRKHLDTCLYVHVILENHMSKGCDEPCWLKFDRCPSLLSAHLSRKLEWAFLIKICPSSS